MPLPPDLEERLICPLCRSRLKIQVSGGYGCLNGHSFSLIGEVPLLRQDATPATVAPQGELDHVDITGILGATGFKRLLRNIIGTNYVPHPFPIEKHIGEDSLVLNLGAGMTGRRFKRVVNLDYFLFPTVDIVADAAAIPFANESFDMVICEFMIEHVPDPYIVCQEMARVLKPGGSLYISYPFIHPYHSFPSDYYRFTHMGIERMLSGLQPLSKGPLTGLASRWIGTTADLLTFWVRPVKMRFALRAIILALLFPVKYIDYYWNRDDAAIQHAVTLYGFFRKPLPEESGVEQN
ncbi:MAG: class I SAM-dependent methyltransferase [Deltaproteobacteria bacterium]|nr:class I SAM-dependent methyltransferase [Deltaproteobacteria bacterium]